MTITWTLDRRPPTAAQAPDLDADQVQVVAHRRGPLLVLAGPGTGKTTTIVEAVLAQIGSEDAPLHPDEVLVLTFGRRAAGELRTRILQRSGGGAIPRVATFHSFAYALMRQLSDPELFAAPPRLLSGPEQQQRIREIILGGMADGTSRWPQALNEALRTRGFAEQVRALVAAVRANGLEGADLVDLASRVDHDVWQAAGHFIEEYLQVSEFEGVLDYTEVLLQAAVLAEQSPEVRTRYRAIYVDEFQDTDPLQVRLLKALVTTNTALVAVGDPDQSIYRFRGADVTGILRFRDEFPTASGQPAPTVVLAHTRRFGPVLRAAATAVIGSVTPTGLDKDSVVRLRNPDCDLGASPGHVEAVLCDDERTQAEFIADLLRRSALDPDDPIPWAQMAVLVRSGTQQIPALRRALVSAGVPVEVAGDEIPLAREPAVAPLLMAAEVVAEPQALTPEIAQALLVSPLGGIDPADLRHVIRELRRRERARLAAQSTEGHISRPTDSGEVLMGLLRDPSVLDDLPPGVLDDTGRLVRRLATLLERARHAVIAGASPADVLWLLWDGSPWPRRLRRSALGTGPGTRRAHADLDAVVALFDEADRAVERRDGVAGLGAFVEELLGQEIPARGLRESAIGQQGVRLLTAHRAKGLEWRLVVVAGVQEGMWPDVRRRDTLLGTDTVGRAPSGEAEVVLPATPAELLAEERRLFYVACTRARETLVVTAVASPDDDGPQPSRFIDALGVQPHQVGPSARVSGEAAQRALSVQSLVATLRRTLTDPASPDEMRLAAADRLAVLASAQYPDGRPIATAANPDSWWGHLELTDPGFPLRDPDQPLPMSGTGIDLIDACALRWFLEREVHAQVASGTSAGFGLVVHAVADLVARGLVAPDQGAVDAAVDRVWDALPYEAPWRSAAERQRAREMLARFLHWHAQRHRTLVGTEVEFRVQVPVADEDVHDMVRLSGSMDIVEAEVSDDAVRVHVADLKTGGIPTAKEIGDHVQLAVYQVAVQHGAVDSAVAAAGINPTLPVESAGAAIIGLREPEGKGKPAPKVRAQEPLPADGSAPILSTIAAAAATMRAERFWASPGRACQYCSFADMCPATTTGTSVAPDPPEVGA